MEIKISPSGEIAINTNGSTPAEVAGTILSIQREIREQQREQEREQEPAQHRPVSLNDCQGETYDWMVSNDAPLGIHTSAVAKAFNISREAANSRLQTLHTLGFIRRVGTGLYRAVTE